MQAAAAGQALNLLDGRPRLEVLQRDLAEDHFETISALPCHVPSRWRSFTAVNTARSPDISSLGQAQSCPSLNRSFLYSMSDMRTRLSQSLSMAPHGDKTDCKTCWISTRSCSCEAHFGAIGPSAGGEPQPELVPSNKVPDGFWFSSRDLEPQTCNHYQLRICTMVS